MMKQILVISAFPPNHNTGGQLFTLKLLEDLGRNNEVDLIYFSFDRDDNTVDCPLIRSVKVIAHSKTRKMLNALFLPFMFPIFSARFSFLNLMKLRRMTPRYDIVLYNYSQVFLYSLFARNDGDCIYICHDVMSQKYSRSRGWGHGIGLWAKYSEWAVMKSLKGKVLCFSKKDREIIAEYKVKSDVIDFYLNKNIAFSDVVNPHQFCFLANWRRPENMNGLTWFFKDVYPNLPSHLVFIVIGKIDEDVADRFRNKYANVHLLGFVDNPYKILSSSAGLIAPLFAGAGVKVKVIEALACGVPVIGTEIAFEGIECVESRFMLVAKKSEDFAINLCNLNFTLNDRKELFERFHLSYGKKNISNLLNESAE